MNKQHNFSRAALGALLVWSGLVAAAIAQQQPGNAAIPFGVGQGNGPGGQGQQGVAGPGLAGGAANADFDSLIDLIQSTVEADSWMENGTGAGEIQPFPTGVYADAAGTLRFSKSAATNLLAGIRSAPRDRAGGNVREASALRFVSLPRLEAAIRARQARHEPLPVEMLTLAGLQRVEYVLVAPETGDLILAGPAGDWQVRADGKIVSVETGQPIVRLDDLLTLWRRKQTTGDEAFGCSIIPRRPALAATQDFLQTSSAEPIEPGERDAWLTDLRDTLGKQDVAFFGLAADSHVARVLLLADYHMKLVGMGLAEGVEGVTSYLDTVELSPDGAAPAMSVLRWWFAMNYEPVETTAERDVYRLRGQAVKVLSENEILAAQGRRVHTGQSDELNRRFAASFTAAFDEICFRYPLYGELRNVFDLALVLSLVEREGLAERVAWQPTLFADDRLLRLPKLTVPADVETVVNHRVIRGRHIIAGISGGVWIDGQRSLEVEVVDGATSPLKRESREAWWWD